ncbi:aspartyl-phosphate phosphatase Spo0E family protein [Halobacillus sp. BBL2006]|uniref:aspartyl-phosphate phosphatase Spo0E family protein n=1 Tax=Halobacillus sp. BBL2006 TaxID=1543706 RepID=UPI0009E0A347|nr:aspartyl-phosphate phosphatase Spo0E family protein [Halobacillus sp. BBL2006]
MQATKNDPLLVKIEQLRKQMSEVALEQGFSSEETVRLSQELDELLYQIQNTDQ